MRYLNWRVSSKDQQSKDVPIVCVCVCVQGTCSGGRAFGISAADASSSPTTF